MNNACAVAAVAGVLSVGIVFAQTKAAVEHRVAKSESASSLRSHEEVPTKVMTLGTVHLSRAVRADDDRLLKPGPYQVRLAGEPLKPVVGETPNLELATT
jgi:hypothetical protein